MAAQGWSGGQPWDRRQISHKPGKGSTTGETFQGFGHEYRRIPLCTTNASDRGFIVHTSFLHDKPFQPEVYQPADPYNTTTLLALQCADTNMIMAAYGLADIPDCKCGRPNGHKGWCSERVKNGPKRQAYLNSVRKNDEQQSQRWS
jgi:hypothetical protein